MRCEINANVYDNGLIELTEHHYTGFDGLVASYARNIIDTKDKTIREALIKLGWTPPKGKSNDQNT